uniref:Pre-rRNA-processing protein TSR2 homolog n=1 Tax=Astatotilapia calliptera TaxID=8154 RepID=A0A3P8PVU3_ASTCA
MAASAASREIFTEGVRAVLQTWPVLQIAVDNGFGGIYGQQKADWMVDVVQQYFHDNADLQQYEVEDFIAELMDQEFNTVVDDGSLPQVSANLLQMFGQWRQGALEQLKHTINTLTQNKSQRAKVTAQPTQSDEESNDDAQEMECEASGPSVSRTHPPPTQDEEDGWTVHVFILSSFSHPNWSQQMAPPLPDPGSAGGFFLLKGSFSFPLLPKCCS